MIACWDDFRYNPDVWPSLSVDDVMEESVIQSKALAMLLVMLAGWINRQQPDVIDYLKEENKILREKLGKKRIISVGSMI